MSDLLTATSGFEQTYERIRAILNLQQMRALYLAYPICDALRHELTWTHYRLLLRVDKPEVRAFYEARRSTPAGPPAKWSGSFTRLRQGGG
jgi:hypothetical protein